MLYGRARGTFKDPNVLGAFLVLPALLALQSVLVDRAGKAMRKRAAFADHQLAVLLSFSRAAWGQPPHLAFVVLVMFSRPAAAQRGCASCCCDPRRGVSRCC